MCVGLTPVLGRATTAQSGPSPRARGSRNPAGEHEVLTRSIPACAGLTRAAGSGLPPTAVHPRVRGAHRGRGQPHTARVGPSPRARGSQLLPRVKCEAHAVHPRVRGAHTPFRRYPDPWIGPSPRARGSQRTQLVGGQRPRSIPACAGLTTARRSPRGSGSVHPRVRGAHPTARHPSGRGGGPSPRARGSQIVVQGPGPAPRSIPACAGLTMGTAGSPRTSSVHPRVRGAHAVLALRGNLTSGPSPRARGSRGPQQGPVLAPRSIPACAGLTMPVIPGIGVSSVHPRVRGAHGGAGCRPVRGSGPSPRARGSLLAEDVSGVHRRSIPACAGLTGRGGSPARAPAVHPRVRGAHDDGANLSGRGRGPSPRARGSPNRPRFSGGSNGPSPRARGSRVNAVKPRTVCGPSPRARGSPGVEPG